MLIISKVLNTNSFLFYIISCIVHSIFLIMKYGFPQRMNSLIQELNSQQTQLDSLGKGHSFSAEKK
jgi:hypothetical protein